MRVLLGLALLTIAPAGACTPAPSPAPPTPRASVIAGRAHDAPPSSALPAGAPSAPATLSVRSVPSPFALALQSSRPVAMLLGSNRRFVTDHSTLAELGPDGFVQTDQLPLLPPENRCDDIETIVGTWPDAAYLSSKSDDASNQPWENLGAIFRSTGHSWSLAFGPTHMHATQDWTDTDGTRIAFLGPWMKQTALVLTRTLARSGQAAIEGASFHVLGGAAPTPRPAAPAPPTEPGCMVRLIPERIASLETGDAFALGPACERQPTGRRYVERWSNGGPRSVVETLPSAPATAGDWRLAVRAANDAYVAWVPHASDVGRMPPYVAHFDGTRWEPQPSPPNPPAPDSNAAQPCANHNPPCTPPGWPFSVAAVSAEGALLLVLDDVWRRVPGGAWEVIPLPDPPSNAASGARLQPYAVWADGSFVWVAASYKVAAGEGSPPWRYALLRTDWARAPFQFHAREPCATW